jgi:ribosomal protein S30
VKEYVSQSKVGKYFHQQPQIISKNFQKNLSPQYQPNRLYLKQKQKLEINLPKI